MSYVYELTQEIDNYLRDAVPDETTDTYYNLLRQASNKLKGLDESILEMKYDISQKCHAIDELRKKIDRYHSALLAALED